MSYIKFKNENNNNFNKNKIIIILMYLFYIRRMSYIKFRYFCLTEGKNITENRLKTDGLPTKCINNPNHHIDDNSITIISSPEIFTPISNVIDQQVTQTSNEVEKIKTQLSNIDSLKNNFSAIVSPLPTDDASKGYSIGSRWVNLTSKESFICLNTKLNNALWHMIDSKSILFSETLDGNPKIIKTFEFIEKGTYVLNLQCFVSSGSISCYIEEKCLIKKDNNLTKLNIDHLSIENERNLNIHFYLKEKDDKHIDLEIKGKENTKILWKFEYKLNYVN